MAQFIDAHTGVLGKPNASERCQRRFAQFIVAARIAPEPKRVAAMSLHRERDIIQRGEFAEQRSNLERAR